MVEDIFKESRKLLKNAVITARTCEIIGNIESKKYRGSVTSDTGAFKSLRSEQFSASLRNDNNSKTDTEAYRRAKEFYRRGAEEEHLL